ncbi:MAG: MFS transporter [Promethearchaeota archaeon]|nr:MAG: MFS transporter [Candidatus Lokiarchaeota archaeon]
MINLNINLTNYVLIYKNKYNLNLEKENIMSDLKEDLKYEPFSNLKMLCFSIGPLLVNLTWIMLRKIQIYATKALGIPIIMVFTIITIWVIWDAINDPITGHLLDKSSKFTSKYGKRYPFILIGILGTLLTIFLLFYPISTSIIILFIWLLIITCIWDFFQTIYELSSEGQIVDIFRDHKQRYKRGGFAHIFIGIATIIGAIIVPVLITTFGGEYDAFAYLYTAIIIIIIVLILTIPYAWSVREPLEMIEFRTNLDKEGKSYSSVTQFIKRAMTDRNWLGFIIIYLGYAVGMNILTTILDFFIVDYLGLPIAYSGLAAAAFLLVSFLSIPIWMKIANKVGSRKTVFYGMIFMLSGHFLILFADTLTTLMIFLPIIGFGWGAMGVGLAANSYEAIDNATLKSGIREESSYLGISRFFVASGLFWQIAIFTLVSYMTGYDPLLGTNNSDLAKLGLKLQLSLIPAIILLICTLLFMKLNIITKEIAIQNKQKLLELGL